MARGTDPVYVNPYQPWSLIEIACRIAILSRFETQAKFVSASRESREWTESSLSTALRKLDRGQVEAIQNVVNAAEDRRGQVRGLDTIKRWYLVSFYDSVMGPPEVAVEARTRHLEGDLPSHHFRGLCNAGPSRSKPEVLVRATAMRTFLAEMRDPAVLDEPLHDGAPPLPSLATRTVRDAITETVQDLCIVATQPPSMGGLEAIRLMSEAGTIALAEIRRRIASESPGSWRLVRVVTECLRRCKVWSESAPEGHPQSRAAVHRAAADLLAFIDDTNPANEYRARSLWEEAVAHLPKTSTDPEFAAQLDQFSERLWRRAVEGHTGLVHADDGSTTTPPHESPLPVRERITAVWTFLWRQCRRAGWNPQELESLAGFGAALEPIRQLAKEIAEPSSGETPDRGLQYASEFIRAAVSDRVFWHWPESGDDERAPGAKRSDIERSRTNRSVPLGTNGWWLESPEAQIVLKSMRSAIRPELIEPAQMILPALQSLCFQACTTIDGVARRECLVTLEVCGLGSAASSVFKRVIQEARREDPAEYRWLIENSVFALGWMNDPHTSFDDLVGLAADRDMHDSIRMTALHAIGDMAEQIRECDAQAGTNWCRSAADLAVAIIEDAPGANDRQGGIYQGKVLVRAAMQVLAMLRMPDDAHVTALEQLRDDREGRFEEATSRALAQWALDRIRTRQAVDAEWAAVLESTNETALLTRWGAPTLRRLADPMTAISEVTARPPTQPSVSRD